MRHQPKSLRELSLIKLSFPDLNKLAAIANLSAARDGATHADLEDSLKSISRRFERFSLKTRALDLYTNNRIAILVNKETVQVPMILPGWRIKGLNDNIVGVVNVVPYVPASGISNMDVRTLFSLMLVSTVLIDTYDHWNKISTSLPIAKNGAIVYTRFIHKVIDRLTGIGLDRLRSDQIKYILAKYFLINLLGREPSETTDNIALGATIGSAQTALVDFENTLGEVIAAKTQADIYGLGFLEFIDAIGKSTPWLNRLTSRAFIQAYTSMYRPAALLAAEDASYFLAILATHQAGSEIASGFAIDPAYGKEGDLILDELARLSQA
jgi:hypothetical protein